MPLKALLSWEHGFHRAFDIGALITCTPGVYGGRPCLHETYGEDISNQLLWANAERRS